MHHFFFIYFGLFSIFYVVQIKKCVTIQIDVTNISMMIYENYTQWKFFK